MNSRMGCLHRKLAAIHSFNKYLLRACCVPKHCLWDIPVGTKKIMVSVPWSIEFESEKERVEGVGWREKERESLMK